MLVVRCFGLFRLGFSAVAFGVVRCFFVVWCVFFFKWMLRDAGGMQLHNMCNTPQRSRRELSWTLTEVCGLKQCFLALPVGNYCLAIVDILVPLRSGSDTLSLGLRCYNIPGKEGKNQKKERSPHHPKLTTWMYPYPLQVESCES